MQCLLDIYGKKFMIVLCLLGLFLKYDVAYFLELYQKVAGKKCEEDIEMV